MPSLREAGEICALGLRGTRARKSVLKNCARTGAKLGHKGTKPPALMQVEPMWFVSKHLR